MIDWEAYMKYVLLGLVFIGGLGLFYIHARSSSDIVDMSAQHNVSIVLTDRGFEPNEIRIKVGTVVTFSTTRPSEFWPAANPHPTHTTFSTFDARQAISASSTWAFTFEKAGSWGYHDHIRSYFVGTIYVEP